MLKSSDSEGKEKNNHSNSRWNINFLLLLWGRMVSDTGSRIQLIVVPLYILDQGGDGATIGLFSFLALAPALLIYPLAGVLGDRCNRKRIMVLTDLISGILILALAAASYQGSLRLSGLMLVQMAVSLLNGLFDPATKGILPKLVSRENLPRANSAVAAMRTLSGLMGPVIGTSLYASFGISILFVMNGLSFLLSGISEMLIRYRHERSRDHTSFKKVLSDGASFVLSNKAIRKLCRFLLAIYGLVMPLFQVLLPLFFRTQLSYSDQKYGWVQIVIMLGALFGSILVGTFFQSHQRRALSYGITLLLLAYLAFSGLTVPSVFNRFEAGSLAYLFYLAFAAGLISAAVMFINVPLQTFIQEQTPENYLSRVFSIVGLISKGGLPFGALLYGAALARFDIHWVGLMVGGLMAVLSVIFRLHRSSDEE